LGWIGCSLLAGLASVLVAVVCKLRLSSAFALFSLFDCCSAIIYPTVIDTHPQKPNQFAVGFTDDSVCGNWIMSQVYKQSSYTSLHFVNMAEKL
jgi:hypothetical protein